MNKRPVCQRVLQLVGRHETEDLKVGNYLVHPGRGELPLKLIGANRRSEDSCPIVHHGHVRWQQASLAHEFGCDVGVRRKAAALVVAKLALEFRVAQLLPAPVRRHSSLGVSDDVDIVTVRDDEKVAELLGKYCEVLVNRQAEQERAKAAALPGTNGVGDICDAPNTRF